MKLEKLCDDNLIVFLNKFYINKFKLSIRDNLEECFKKLFKILFLAFNVSHYNSCELGARCGALRAKLRIAYTVYKALCVCPLQLRERPL